MSKTLTLPTKKANRKAATKKTFDLLAFYSIDEVAEILGVHRETVGNMRRQGLKTCKAGRLVRILGSDLLAFMAGEQDGQAGAGVIGQSEEQGRVVSPVATEVA